MLISIAQAILLLGISCSQGEYGISQEVQHSSSAQHRVTEQGTEWHTQVLDAN